MVTEGLILQFVHFAWIRNKYYNVIKMEGSTNLALNFFTWWYGEAFAKLFVFLERFVIYLFDLFSVKICLSTLFAPWKRDMLGTKGLSVQEQFQVHALNFSSRFIGAFIKICTIITFLIFTGIAIILSVFLLVLWLVWLPAALLLIAIGFYG